MLLLLLKAITEALSHADVQVFLHATEALAQGLRDFVDTLRTQCFAVSWSEDALIVGAIFTAPNTARVFNQYKSYSMEQQGVLRLLKGALFAEFYRDADTLAHMLGQGSFADVLASPRERPAAYKIFLEQLLSATPSNHVDYETVVAAAANMATVAADIEKV